METPHIYPKGKRILVKADEIMTETQSGIILQIDESREQASVMTGTVVAIGEDAWDEWSENWAEVGDWVLYAKFAGKSVQDPITQEVYSVMNDIDLVATLDRPEEEEKDA
jgi:co-chaperonin GroES (HSP10)